MQEKYNKQNYTKFLSNLYSLVTLLLACVGHRDMLVSIRIIGTSNLSPFTTGLRYYLSIDSAIKYISNISTRITVLIRCYVNITIVCQYHHSIYLYISCLIVSPQWQQMAFSIFLIIFIIFSYFINGSVYPFT